MDESNPTCNKRLAKLGVPYEEARRTLKWAEPVLPQGRHGAVPNVVFPTGIDRRDDLGSSDRVVAPLDLPDFLPLEGVADAPEAKV
jgi:hypothetical protein